MGIAERKEREREEMRKLILDAANQLFRKQGLEKTSIRNIADEIEYSPATIYLYFKDKDEIFLDLHDRYFDQFFEYLKEAEQIENPMERLRKMGDIYLSFASKYPEYYEVMFLMDAPLTVLRRKTEDWHCGFKSFELLKTTVQECMEKGLMRWMHLETAAFMIMSQVHGIASLMIKDRLVMFPEDMHQILFQSALDNMMAMFKREN